MLPRHGVAGHDWDPLLALKGLRASHLCLWGVMASESKFDAGELGLTHLAAQLPGGDEEALLAAFLKDVGHEVVAGETAMASTQGLAGMLLMTPVPPDMELPALMAGTFLRLIAHQGTASYVEVGRACVAKGLSNVGNKEDKCTRLAAVEMLKKTNEDVSKAQALAVAKKKADDEYREARRKDVLRRAEVYKTENSRPRKTCALCSKGKMLLVSTNLTGWGVTGTSTEYTTQCSHCGRSEEWTEKDSV